jgi:hypothetical protein
MLVGNQVVVNVLGWPVAIEICVVAQSGAEWVPLGGQHYLVMDLLDAVIRREVESADQVVFGVVRHR